MALDSDSLSLSSSTQPTSQQSSRPVSPPPRKKAYAFATQCVTVENPEGGKDQYNASSVPIYQTATFKGMGGEYDYTRSGNPTRTHLEHHLSKISGSRHAFAISSGMAALDIITRILKPGDEVIAGDDLYGGTNRLLTYIRTHMGVVVHHVDTTTPSALEPFLNAQKTRMVLLETPTNPLIKICDIEDIARRVRRVAPDAVIVVDNTMMSPYLQRPLEVGADIVYDSATKYLSGHHDLMAGVIVCDRDDLAKQIAFTINSVGNALVPFDSFLLLRGLKTLALRLDKQQATAGAIAYFLHTLGFKAHYPGLPNHSDRDIHFRLAKGAGAVLSFETGSIRTSERIVGGTRLWGISVSFGAVNSLISMPCLMSHASIPAHLRAERGLPEDLIRLCVGIEDPVDLLDDLENALLEAGAIRPRYGRKAAFTTAEGTLERLGEERALGWERADLFGEGGAGQTLGGLEDGVKDLDLEKHSEEGLVVSAPGKVILFGEHAVVHGVTAIAASVDLRCYGLLSPRSDNKLALELPDISFSYAWDIPTLPWSGLPASSVTGVAAPELDAGLVKALETLVPATDDNAKSRAAAIAFLYLYMLLVKGDDRPGFTFTARSALPIGAGLGSSASYSTCLSSALVISLSHVALPEPYLAPAHVHVSHSGRRLIPTELAERVNAWAFLAEKVLHGNPSGVDNAVAVHGGAVAFTRAVEGKKGGMENVHGFKSIRFLLTDSKVPRDTKTLVAGVGARKQKEPEVINSILDAIQVISDEAGRCLSDVELSREALLKSLCAMIDENHEHLVSLGVSHPALEAIRSKTRAAPYELHTKLTGAGGGGCAVTLIPDEFPESHLASLLTSLRDDGFDTYLTSVGGSGFGVLHPSRRANASAAVQAEGGDEGAILPDRARFRETPAPDLAAWAEHAGRWAFV